MSWEAIVPIIDKIGLVAVVIFVGFLVAKLVARFLVDVTIWAKPDPEEPGSDGDTQESGVDLAEGAPGLHVYSAYEREHRIVDANPTEDTIRATLRRLDWDGGFHHVWLVTDPGKSLEVSGSLDPDYGLSSAYRDLNNDIIRVISEPPMSVKNMEDLLVSFHRGDGRWEQMYVFDWDRLSKSGD